MGRRNLYLNMLPAEEALEIYLKAVREGGAGPLPERLETGRALGRVTAEAVVAKCCSPLFNAAAMDGIAVRAEATRGASEHMPVILEEGRDYMEVDTGDPVKMPYDAVIMAENLLPAGDGKVRIIEAVPAWQHVRPVGEDIVEGELLIPKGHIMRPVDVAAAVAGGNGEIEVFAKPRVGIIPTGTEIRATEGMTYTRDVPEGTIIDSNSYMFDGMIGEAGGIGRIYPVVEDDYGKIKEKILEAAEENDIVIVNAGSSAGREDYTVHVLREIGQVLVHGVAIKPGKPVILAMVGKKPVIGLPGYPVSAYIGFENFAEPVLALFTGRAAAKRKTVTATLSRRLVSSLKHREYVRVRVGRVGNKLVASPLARGAGAAMSLVKADGFCVIPQNSEGFEAGEEVSIELYKPEEDLGSALVSIGSHDLILDVIADMMNLSSSHVGSMGGLLALKKGETVIAPTHLLDRETGQYNVSYMKNMFGCGKASLIRGVERIQGIMVKKGNPLKIRGIEDLKSCRFVNRQKGAGTRVLLDYQLMKNGISPDEIDGYDKEATTHMAVAALVAKEDIDAGLGIESAARAMDLDFIPVGVEEYDFAVMNKDLDLPEVQEFISVLKSKALHKKLEEMGGYGWTRAGEVVRI